MGPYELLEPVGRGGMGTVYRGRHRETGKVVAVKIMTAEAASDPVHLRRFEQEFWAATRLQHSNIVRGLDFGLEGGRHYLVMEFVDGQNLNLHVKKQGPLALAAALKLTLEIASALELAHHNKLVHRDVKPENIILDRDGKALLTDLGLIKDLDADVGVTRSRMALGTVNFMAPEQFEDAKYADARCDIYGLGATCYFALTGLLPFPGRGPLNILGKKLKNDFVPPGKLLPTLPESINAAICKALEASQERRQQSCAELMIPLNQAWLALPEAKVHSSTLPSQAPPEVQERRVASRFASGLEASIRPLQQRESRFWMAEIQDASISGLRFQLDRRFEPNTVLAVEVLDDNTNVISQWFVRVRWVREIAPKKWGHGCTFSRELGESELNTLLQGKATSIVVHPDLSQPPPQNLPPGK